MIVSRSEFRDAIAWAALDICRAAESHPLIGSGYRSIEQITPARQGLDQPLPIVMKRLTDFADALHE